jgi:hypothetical protein
MCLISQTPTQSVGQSVSQSVSQSVNQSINLGEQSSISFHKERTNKYTHVMHTVCVHILVGWVVTLMRSRKKLSLHMACSASQQISCIMVTHSMGNDPFAVSPDNMTKSAPSKTAFATSVALWNAQAVTHKNQLFIRKTGDRGGALWRWTELTYSARVGRGFLIMDSSI